jgi:hypothetical protein
MQPHTRFGANLSVFARAWKTFTASPWRSFVPDTQASCDTYSGPERRHHTMYVTRNTEYHLRDGICVAVRDRNTGQWLTGHSALRRELSGAVRFLPNGHALPSTAQPKLGDALYFGGGGRELVTSMLSAIERPGRVAVARYGRLASL